MGAGSAPAAEYTAARDSEGELLRVVSTLRELRSKFYAELDLVSSRLQQILQRSCYCYCLFIVQPPLSLPSPAACLAWQQARC
jgi:hypothetical protein